MRTFNLILLLVGALLMVLVACGPGGEDNGPGEASGTLVGDAARGEALYKQPIIGEASAPGCAACHSLAADVILVGPSTNGIGKRAVDAEVGLSAEQFLEKSIREPNAHITDGFAPGVMYQFYGTDLSAQEIADLVAFLKTQ